MRLITLIDKYFLKDNPHYRTFKSPEVRFDYLKGHIVDHLKFHTDLYAFFIATIIGLSLFGYIANSDIKEYNNKCHDFTQEQSIKNQRHSDLTDKLNLE